MKMAYPDHLPSPLDGSEEGRAALEEADAANQASSDATPIPYDEEGKKAAVSEGSGPSSLSPMAVLALEVAKTYPVFPCNPGPDPKWIKRPLIGRDKDENGRPI